MKYIVILGDGMSDYPVKALNGKTPLEVAERPEMNDLASKGLMGLVQVCPDGIKAGSDTANMAILGYHPGRYFSGRGPLEAASMGIPLGPEDVAFRMNVVSVREGLGTDLEHLHMEDYSAGHISSDSAAEFVEALKKEFADENVALYAGKQYRHILVTRNNVGLQAQCFPPHDHMGENIEVILPHGRGSEFLRHLIRRSRRFFADHPLNKKRVAAGKKKVDMIWPWGQGKAPAMEKLTERFKITGSMISAVDLLQGLGIFAGLEVLQVEGATGYHDTNYKNKAQAAIETLKTKDFVFVHLESTDEAGHEGNVEEKIRGIERLDARIVKPIREFLRSQNLPHKILVLPDHATPVEVRTHVDDPVPFILYSSEMEEKNGARTYSELSAKETGVFLKEGWKLMDLMISGLSG